MGSCSLISQAVIQKFIRSFEVSKWCVWYWWKLIRTFKCLPLNAWLTKIQSRRHSTLESGFVASKFWSYTGRKYHFLGWIIQPPLCAIAIAFYFEKKKKKRNHLWFSTCTQLFWGGYSCIWPRLLLIYDHASLSIISVVLHLFTIFHAHHYKWKFMNFIERGIRGASMFGNISIFVNFFLELFNSSSQSVRQTCSTCILQNWCSVTSFKVRLEILQVANLCFCPTRDIGLQLCFPIQKHKQWVIAFLMKCALPLPWMIKKILNSLPFWNGWNGKYF